MQPPPCNPVDSGCPGSRPMQPPLAIPSIPVDRDRIRHDPPLSYRRFRSTGIASGATPPLPPSDSGELSAFLRRCNFQVGRTIPMEAVGSRSSCRADRRRLVFPIETVAPRSVWRQKTSRAPTSREFFRPKPAGTPAELPTAPSRACLLLVSGRSLVRALVGGQLLLNY